MKSLLSLLFLPCLAVAAFAADATTFDPTPIPVISQGSSGVPVGTVIAWPSASLPPASTGAIPVQSACVTAASDDEAASLGCEWLEADGSTLNPAAYPALSAAMGPILPDMRGEFLRGWDHGRGVDSGRNVATAQLDALQNITGKFRSATEKTDQHGDNTDGAFKSTYSPLDNNAYRSGVNIKSYKDFNFDASWVARTGTETRPRNIAVMYVIRAR